jgi:hypothetical protein
MTKRCVISSCALRGSVPALWRAPQYLDIPYFLERIWQGIRSRADEEGQRRAAAHAQRYFASGVLHRSSDEGRLSEGAEGAGGMGVVRRVPKSRTAHWHRAGRVLERARVHGGWAGAHCVQFWQRMRRGGSTRVG